MEENLLSVVFALRKELACPLCQGLFSEPVTAPSCGHTFCR